LGLERGRTGLLTPPCIPAVAGAGAAALGTDELGCAGFAGSRCTSGSRGGGGFTSGTGAGSGAGTGWGTGGGGIGGGSGGGGGVSGAGGGAAGAGGAATRSTSTADSVAGSGTAAVSIRKPKRSSAWQPSATAPATIHSRFTARVSTAFRWRSS
jgi:hypothetical protein